MAPVSHQTIKLGKGKHISPREGACVMELASMLAGEPFSDQPVSVCPVIGSFLRAYNDSIDHERRQDLYSYAAKVVGSRASEEIQAARADRLAEWAANVRPRRLSRLLPFSQRLQAIAQGPFPEAVGTRAVNAIVRHNDRNHAEVLALIDELLGIGRADSQAASAAAAVPAAVRVS